MALLDARTFEDGRTLEADICVAGAGPAGTALATRLAGSSIDVCVLEGGGMEAGDGGQSLYEGKCTGLPYYPFNAVPYPLKESRGRGFGGSTTLWGGLCAPLEPIVFEERPWVPHSGWPIDREDLDPYYAIAQRLLEVGPYQYGPEYWEERFPEYRQFLPGSAVVENRVVQFSRSQREATSDGGTTWTDPKRLNTSFRDVLVEAENVTVVTHANVVEIETPPSASTVTGFKARRLDGTSFRAVADQYVLACGGIENPRLLLSSNRHAPMGLGNENDLVGRFFMEHPHVPSARLSLATPRALMAYRRHFTRDAHQFHFTSRPPVFHLKASEEVQRAEQILNGHLRLDARPSGVRSAQALWRKMKSMRNGDRSASGVSGDIESLWSDFESVASGLIRALPGNDERSYRFGRLNVLTIMEQTPNPDSRITLGEERDALGVRRPELHWQLSDLDRRSARRLNEILGQELRRTGEGRLRVPEWLDDERAWRPEKPAVPARYMLGGSGFPRFWGVCHHMGTTRMAETPSRGVCDKNGRVYGVENLYVSGSSVFPTSGSVPPTLTIVALAVRLADHLTNSK
jgi:choline dehydrogenase-like flavoprotein